MSTVHFLVYVEGVPTVPFLVLLCRRVPTVPFLRFLRSLSISTSPKKPAGVKLHAQPGKHSHGLGIRRPQSQNTNSGSVVSHFEYQQLRASSVGNFWAHEYSPFRLLWQGSLDKLKTLTYKKDASIADRNSTYNYNPYLQGTRCLHCWSAEGSRPRPRPPSWCSGIEISWYLNNKTRY